MVAIRRLKTFSEQSRELDRRLAKRKLDKDVEMGISSAALGNGPIDPIVASAESYNIATPKSGSEDSLDALGGKSGGKGVMTCFGCDG